MAGLLPLSIEMTNQLVHFGYVDVHFVGDRFAPEHPRLRGHSFHCSRVAREGDVGKETIVRYSLSGEERREGYAAGNVFGSYIHLHFASSRSFAARFLDLARNGVREHEVGA